MLTRTRTKERPTKSDLKSIHKVLETLMNQNRVSPIEDPFDYLWIANCALFSVVVAFLLLKGWKKHKSGQPTITRTKLDDKWKIAYEKKVIETRSKISIAKAEMERIRENRKLTKRGRKNREMLEKECRNLSVAELITYMEKYKSVLRKLKSGFIRRKKVEESGRLNRQFEIDPGRVYDQFNNIAKNKKDCINGTPTYKSNLDDSKEECQMFDDIEEASGFWRDLWGERGTGDPSADWFKEIKNTINKRVPAPSEEEWNLELKQVLKSVSIALRIPTAHDFRVISARMSTCAYKT